MNPRMPLLATLLPVLLSMPSPVSACGEGIYAMGPETHARGYLAPRLATVLVYNNHGTVPEATKAVYRGLVQAGHKVRVARNPEQLASALHDRNYDVVIADYDQIDAVGNQARPASAARLLPIVASGQRDAVELRQRFRFTLAQGAGLNQYLKLIDQLVKDGS